jgi:hypothetical protein
VQIIAKRIAPPDVPLVRPTFVWPLEGELPLLDDSDLDEDFVDIMMSHDEEPDHIPTVGHSAVRAWR